MQTRQPPTKAGTEPNLRLARLLAAWEPIDDEFPDVDEGLLPLDEVEL